MALLSSDWHCNWENGAAGLAPEHGHSKLYSMIPLDEHECIAQNWRFMKR